MCSSSQTFDILHQVVRHLYWPFWTVYKVKGWIPAWSMCEYRYINTTELIFASLVFSDEKQLERNVVLKNFLWLMLAWKWMLLYRATWCPVEAALFLGGIPLINTTLLQKIPCDKWNWISDLISLTLLPSLLLFDMTALSNTAFTFKKGHWRSAGPSAEIHWQLCLGAIALTAQSN